ncbi:MULTISPECIES: response regulator transcription factor [unclassified Paenibacillus]|uniref:response regulator transcription factor n=1 Tax=unclassified Paenibacillus TaxID=185978 RepID=UPI000414A8B4|nr:MULTISPECIES: helix-turn-helix domain-containing protein [unclassified Paenibacillus]KGP78879.1 chemotaxis protein CheY [Paenibacillus sp. MAEPY2]KGP88641.1 chemotaxis protein CheY [Paenibacillus sp. MAEPY1]
MMNVVLVDDEPWVLEGLRTMVDWNKYGFQICGEAENGNAAWAIIEDLQPDLVFTDIHMPSVSGLELIDRSIQKLAKPPRFVILSGYERFDYAKTALEQRVEDYLLKPIDEVEIENVLEQMSRKIQNELVSEKLHQHERTLYVNCLFNRLFQGEESSELQAEVKSIMQMEGHENMACLLIETDACHEDIKSQVQRFASAQHYELYMDTEGRIGVFAAGMDDSLSWLERLGSTLFEMYSSQATIIVAFAYHSGGVVAMRTAYEKAFSALKWKRYQIGSGIIYDQDLPRDGSMATVNQKALTNLFKIILTGQEDGLEKEVYELLVNPDSGLPASDIEYVRVQLLALEMGVLKQLKELDGDVERFVLQLQHTLGVLTDIESFPAFREYALILSLKALRALQEQRREKECCTIFRVVQYVNQEFREKLQLQELAQKFHMNANYLGQAFKQQTGKSFREYLNDKRIEEAKKLLRQSCSSIAEVAVNSGYPNADYFVSQFKRMTGMAPSAYRKQP